MSQSTAGWRRFASVGQAVSSARNVPNLPMRRPLGHCWVGAPSFLSAMFSQLPRFGVQRNSIRRARRLARAGSNALQKTPSVCVLGLPDPKVTFS